MYIGVGKGKVEDSHWEGSGWATIENSLPREEGEIVGEAGTVSGPG